MNSNKKFALNCFSSYLPITQNWALRLIKNTPNYKFCIAANTFLKGSFYQTGIKYFRRPFSDIGINNQRLNILYQYLDSIFLPFYLIWLRFHLRSHNIDIVHCHFADTGWRYRKLPRHLGVPLVVSFYGWDYEHLPTIRPRWKPRIRQLFKDADILICEGPHGAELLKSMGCNKAKIRICRLGIEPDTISHCKRRKVSGQLKLLQIASFRGKKGHADTIRAFARARTTCPNATLTMVGDGDKDVLDDVRSVIAAEGMKDRVHILRQIDFSRLHEFMSDYDVFIHPSVHTPLNDCEGGAPIVLLDAQATGMPVISTRHCDIPEEVVDEQTGLLVAEHDIEGLRLAIQRFYIMEQNEYDNFSSQARAHVTEKFDVKKSGEKLTKIYDTTIESFFTHAE